VRGPHARRVQRGEGWRNGSCARLIPALRFDPHCERANAVGEWPLFRWPAWFELHKGLVQSVALARSSRACPASPLRPLRCPTPSRLLSAYVADCLESARRLTVAECQLRESCAYGVHMAKSSAARPAARKPRMASGCSRVSGIYNHILLCPK
jgi:hypothetical protein